MEKLRKTVNPTEMGERKKKKRSLTFQEPDAKPFVSPRFKNKMGLYKDQQ